MKISMLYINKLKQVLSNKYLRNVGWMGGAEVANRLIRLGSTVILARVFSPQDYGLMAVIFTISDFANAFMLKGGIGAKIIQADEKDLNPICDTAYWLNWLTCGALFIVQGIIALLLPYFSFDPNITLPLFLVSFTYLVSPLISIPLVLIERENRFKDVAICNLIISLVSNSLTAVFVLMGLGIWAIVWAMLSGSLAWIVLARRFHPWRPPLRFSLERWRDVLSFGSNLLINDLLNRVRSNVDYLIVGKYLGVEALGMYYFAFNAGSGITFSLLNTFMTPLYPYICAARNDYGQFKHRYFSSLKKVSLILVPLICLQASLAPIYVPIVFGKKWVPAIPILILICLSVIPVIYSWAASLLLNAIDKTRISLYISAASTAIFVLSILSVVQGGIVWVAFAVFLNSLVVSSLTTLLIQKFVFRKNHFSKLS